MWKKSNLTTITLNGVTGKKKIIRDGHKEHSVFDIIIEFNKSNSTLSVCAEDLDSTFDLISGKEKNTPKKISTKSESSSYFKSYAESKAETFGFIVEEDPFWIEKNSDVYELFSNKRLVARIYVTEEDLDCYVFYRGKRFDDYIRFRDDDINNAKFLCTDKANLMGWRVNYE